MALMRCPALGLWESDDAGHDPLARAGFRNVQLSHVDVTVIESVSQHLGLTASPVFLFELEATYQSAREREVAPWGSHREQGFQVLRSENDFKVAYACWAVLTVQAHHASPYLSFSNNLGTVRVAPKDFQRGDHSTYTSC